MCGAAIPSTQTKGEDALGRIGCGAQHLCERLGPQALAGPCGSIRRVRGVESSRNGT